MVKLEPICGQVIFGFSWYNSLKICLPFILFFLFFHVQNHLHINSSHHSKFPCTFTMLHRQPTPFTPSHNNHIYLNAYYCKLLPSFLKLSRIPSMYKAILLMFWLLHAFSKLMFSFLLSTKLMFSKWWKVKSTQLFD